MAITDAHIGADGGYEGGEQFDFAWPKPEATEPHGDSIVEIPINDGVTALEGIGRATEPLGTPGSAIGPETVYPTDLKRTVFGDSLGVSVFGVMRDSGHDFTKY